MIRPVRTLIRIFVTGALAALPLAATVLAFAWAAGVLIKWLGPDSAVGGLLGWIGLGVGASEVVGYTIGVAIVAVLVFGLGLLVEAGLQRGLASAFNTLLLRIPVVGTVYDLMKRMVGLLRTSEGNDGLKRMSAVWCHFGGPKAEGSSVALALLASQEPVLVDGRPCLAVLIPTSPVPVGGGLIFVPVHWVTPADGVGVEAVMSIYVSMGLTASQYLDRPRSASTAPPPVGTTGEPAPPDSRRLLGQPGP